ncbi:transcription factor TFIIIB component B'' homolog isoform X1 [Hemibagrus wyckioides]|nr:transcription factor TFIIIB component B'' homolog isoform X1 [Hemibagrus wyckioides]XP_058271051.1 transcription factor TFIIIB component B'' homolog isoform X1 [Hemibagrus wyckioides]XP_058271052.1 transcription factor TFIIIB component B'' homolog isoform X1 [Hemibagrus wyckioides]
MIRRSRISVRPNVKPTGRAAATSREAPADLSDHAEVKAGAEESITEVKAGAEESITEVKAGAEESITEVKAGAEESITEVKSAVPAPEMSDNTESQSGDVTRQSDLSLNAADVAGQSAFTSSLSTRRKRFSVLPNLSKPRSTPTPTLTSSKPRKSPARPEPTPEIPPTSTNIASVVSESPDKQEPTQEPAPEPLPVSTKSARSPAPKLPSPSVHSISKTSRFHTKVTKPTPEKVLSTPESAPELPAAPLTRSEGKSKRKKPKLVTSTQDNTETSSCRSDEAEPRSADQGAAESSCPGEEVRSHHSPTDSETQNEPVVQDGSDLSSPGESKKPQQHVPLALRSLNDPVDRLRLARAKKLRELLKKEMNKEKQKKQQKSPTGISKSKKTKDHTKMTMRELIYYLPSTNPMKSYTEDEQRAETDSPSPLKAAPAVPSATEENAAEEEEEHEGEEEEPMLAPRVKVAEDGSLIIDEESLTVRVQRMKGPNLMEERDPIFERGSTTTYSSFRKGTYTKPWSNRETDMFFLAISMVGTDFSMIGQLFPHRARIEIKNKFKKEERTNSWRIDKAFKEKRRLDLDFFSKLLAQILKDEEEKRKKRKCTSQVSKLPCRRPGERKKMIYSSDSEEDESSSSDAMDGEKENENVCSDGERSAPPKRKRMEVSQRKSRKANRSAEQEAEEEAERSSNEETSPVNELDSVEKETEGLGVKSVRKRRRNRGAVVQKKAEDTHTSVREERAKDSSASVQEKTRHTSDVISCRLQDSETEDEPDVSTIQEHILNKPTRSGRIPKLSQQMIRAAADEEDDEEEEQPPPRPLPPDGRPRGSQAKQGRWRAPHQGKSKLLTLVASVTEDEDDDEEEYGTNQEEENYSVNAEEENQPFVPMGLRSLRTVESEVEETMEELDISVNVPDVLGISQNAVCPELSCERALSTMGSVPCEHQLDLLVGVIEFLGPDHMEVSEEAARTLLTIGHSANVTQTELSSTGDVIIVEDSSTPVHEIVMETMDQSETMETCNIMTSDLSSGITSQTDSVSTVVTEDKTPPQGSASTPEPVSGQENKPLSTEIQPETSNITVPEPTALKTRRNRLPKPNLSRASKPTQREPAIAATCSVETCSTPVKDDREAKTVESQTSAVKDLSPEEPSQPEPEEQYSEACKERENKSEGCSSDLQLEEKMEDGDSGQRSRVENERKEETQQAHSESESRPPGSECSVKPSQAVRRCRGAKPKPNLVRNVRTTHTVTDVQKDPPEVPDEKQSAASTLPDIQQPEEGANLIPESEREPPHDSVTVILDDNPVEPPKSVCETSTPDEPVFILSLTEVLPTLTERAGLVTNPLSLSATSGTVPEPISAIEGAAADVGGTGPDGDQVFSQLLPDALIPVSEEGESEKRENETSRGKEEESSSREPSQTVSAPERPDEPPMEPSASSCTAEEKVKEMDCPAKWRKLPERGRRAKVQIEPNSNQRKTRRDISPPDETRSTPASSCERTLEETEPWPTSSEIASSSLASTEELSPSEILDIKEDTLSSTVLDKNSKTSTASPEQSRAISPPPVRRETPPPQASSSSSQGVVENINFPETDPVEPSASGVEVGSQPVHQTTPLASTGPLTRPGRRPKGFLSFMSSANSQRPSESARVPQKPATITSSRGRGRATPSTSTPPPPPSQTPPSPSTQPPDVSSHTQAGTSGENPNAAEADEEPTSVSAYFFNDIFTEVDEEDELD